MQKMQMRKRNKAALQDRKSAASHARMQNVASLAVDVAGSRKRRKGNEGQTCRPSSEPRYQEYLIAGSGAYTEDDFGADDADWQIYRKINLGAPDESEEEDIARLGVIEKQLLEYDPTFSLEQTYASVSTATSKLLAAFRPGYSEIDARGHARIHLNVERWRVPEVWFSPGMAGVDSAGLGEAITFVLGKFKPEHRLRMAKVSLRLHPYTAK
jgi:actin-related protein 5